MIACRIGCAGWNLPKDMRRASSETYLEQYAHIFNCVEINSSFYRHHQFKTYQRWSSVVPREFRFSVKFPKTFTHECESIREIAPRFFQEVTGLGEKLSAVLIQFPPTREFDSVNLSEMFSVIRKFYKNTIACEARHPSWFNEKASAILSVHSAKSVIADPRSVQNAPSISNDLRDCYLRLHGTPRMYYSNYTIEFLKSLKNRGIFKHENTWLIFDNTANGHGFRNAKYMYELDKL